MKRSSRDLAGAFFRRRLRSALATGLALIPCGSSARISRPSVMGAILIALALELVLAPPAAASDWVKVWETPSATGFIDRESITTAPDNIVGVWVRTVHRSPQVANPTEVRSVAEGQDPELVAQGIFRASNGEYYHMPESSISDWQAVSPVHFLAEKSLHQFDCNRREFRILESSIFSDAQAEKLAFSLAHAQSVERNATRILHVYPESLREIEFNMVCARGTVTKLNDVESVRQRGQSGHGPKSAHAVGLAAASLLLPVSLLYALCYLVLRRFRMIGLSPIGIAFSWLLSWGTATLLWRAFRNGDFGSSVPPEALPVVCGLISVLAILLLVVVARQARSAQ